MRSRALARSLIPGLRGQHHRERSPGRSPARWMLTGADAGRGLFWTSGAPGSLVGTIFVTSDFAQERAMTTQNVPAGTSAAAITATSARPAPVPAPPSWAWRRGALVLAGAAQLIRSEEHTSELQSL